MYILNSFLIHTFFFDVTHAGRVNLMLLFAILHARSLICSNYAFDSKCRANYNNNRINAFILALTTQYVWCQSLSINLVAHFFLAYTKWLIRRYGDYNNCKNMRHTHGSCVFTFNSLFYRIAADSSGVNLWKMHKQIEIGAMPAIKKI